MNTIDEVELLTERVEVTYTEDEVYENKHSRRSALSEVKISKHKKTNKTYREQKKCAKKIVNAFKDRRILNAILVALTQSGKTGIISEVIRLCIKLRIVPVKDIYLISGHSSCEMKEQTKCRMIECIRVHVYHRPDLKNTSFLEEIRNKKNVLIIIDEVQVAAKKEQSVYRLLKDAGLLDIQELYRRDIKILELTATPDGTINQLHDWGNASCKILFEPNEKYVSAQNLLDAGRIKQFQNLSGDEEEVREHIQDIKRDLETYDSPRYHFIRIKGGNEMTSTKMNFMHEFGVEYKYIEFNQKSQTKDINDIISVRPTVHTFVFILEKLRCAKTLVKKHIGIMYERYSKKPDDAAIMQGLLGRCTGYDDNGDTIVYTNINTIERYMELWNSNFESSRIPWRSKTTVYSRKTGLTVSKSTFNDPVLYGISGNDYVPRLNEDVTEVVVDAAKRRKNAKKILKDNTYTHICDTFDDVRTFYMNHLKPIYGGHGPQRKKPVNGFYLSSSGKGENNMRPRTIAEVQSMCHWTLTHSHNYTVHPGYEDINDPSTVKWLITYIIKN